MKNRVEIRYCKKCRWLLRSTWMAQEILSTFEDSVAEVALVPGEKAVFEIRVDNNLVWSRERDRGFPEIKTLKSRIRDIIEPGRDLGHIDCKGSAKEDQQGPCQPEGLS